MPRKRKRIAVVGGGAKAAAIAAKAHCLRKIFEVPVEVIIFEAITIGAHWSGEHGYTNGDQRLCTPAEKDLGFPYSSEAFGEDAVRMMRDLFSWSAFLESKRMYARWVDRGRLKPTHRAFSQYLSFCMEMAKPEIVQARVQHLSVGRKRTWNIHVSNEGLDSIHRGFDAVVITGPGPASGRFRISDPRLFDSVNFWSSLPSIVGYMGQSGHHVVIIGSGGAAAAIAGWTVSAGLKNEVLVLGNQASLFARVENPFESDAFTNREVWGSLSFDVREKFTERLNRGAVWSSVIDTLSKADNVSYVPGSALSVELVDAKNSASDLIVKFKTSASNKVRSTPEACVVIDATGFNAFWFTDLLDPVYARRLKRKGSTVLERMLPSLQLPFSDLPPIHVPTLSQAVSPAFNSLMALGDMADEVLRPYVEFT